MRIVETEEFFRTRIGWVDRVVCPQSGAQYWIVANHLYRVPPDHGAADVGTARAHELINGLAETFQDRCGADPDNSCNDRQGDQGDRPESGQAKPFGAWLIIRWNAPARSFPQNGE